MPTGRENLFYFQSQSHLHSPVTIIEFEKGENPSEQDLGENIILIDPTLKIPKLRFWGNSFFFLH